MTAMREEPQSWIAARVIFSLSVAASAIACGGQDNPQPQVLRTDSAGIEIVYSPAPAGEDTIDTGPLWRFGDGATSDGVTASLQNFDDVVASSTGLILLADPMNHVVVALDSRGKLRWRFGREGEGPGEFKGSFSIAAVADTAFVLEFGTRRLTAIGPEGKLLRVVPVTWNAPNVTLAGSSDDGRLLLASRHLLGPEPGINRDSVALAWLDTDGGLGAPLQGSARYGNFDFVMKSTGPNIRPQAYGPTGSVTSNAGGLYHADGVLPEVHHRDVTGRLVRILRWSLAPRAVTEADRVAYAEAERSRPMDSFRKIQLEEWLAHATWPASMPATGQLTAALDGRLIVAAECAASARHCAWYEFDPRGQWSRTLWLPARARHAAITGTIFVTLSSDHEGFVVAEGWRIPAAN
ncbi:MAG: hypothetical protein SFU84_15140 [Gemmatimonadales bacterium]|nr:hypothetical protein [Gemmatimonadales bacterium]